MTLTVTRGYQQGRYLILVHHVYALHCFKDITTYLPNVTAMTLKRL